MINILFFASYRETLGTDTFQLQLDAPCTVSQLIDQLSEKGAIWHALFSQSNVMIAINQQMANREATIQVGDEIAFFPPVTGG